MADSATRAQRAAALEEKRRRLDALKQRRTKRGDTEAANSKSGNLDEYIDGLLSQPSAAAAPAPAAAAAMPEMQPTSNESITEKLDDNKSSTSAASNVIAEPAPAPPPKMIETFTVSTQTDPEDFPELETDLEEEVDVMENGDKTAEAQAERPAVVEVEPEKEPKVLSAEEVEKEVQAAPFSSFINTASKKVERMLGTPLLADLLVDYVGETDGVRREAKDSDESRFLTSRQLFECPVWTSGRDVTDLDWSPLHRELLLSTHHLQTAPAAVVASKGSSASSHKDSLSSSLTPRSGELQSDGLALVWNLIMPSRPEHIFTCGSPVTAGRFHPTESPLVIGGCESGQLVVWDVRASRLPVQKSALSSVTGASSKGHVYPIETMEIIEGGLGLCTSSTDGRVNFWSLANLRDPVESLQVSDSVSSFCVVPESEGLLLGDENGALYTAMAASQGQRRKQVRKLETVDGDGENLGHYGMVTAVSTKTLKKGSTSRAAGLAKGFLRGSGGLVLSAGVDWTVKLWAPAYTDTPLTTLVSHSYDYMSDVQWCPNHPGLFATASSNGTVGLWNLVESLEDPLTGVDGLVIEPDAASGRGLNRLRWSGDGRRLAVAAGDHVHVLHLTEDTIKSKPEDETRLMNHLMARGWINRQ